MLNLVLATKTEAEPLIEELKLKHEPAPFPFYKKDQVSLIISGIGKCRAAAASAWLGGLGAPTSVNNHQNKSGCWLNIGIAGHLDAAIGTIFTAHKVLDHGCDKVWYPPRVSPPLESENLITVDKPLTTYIPNQLHDMEASGFIETARMFSYAELVQCIKVVSDNADQPFTKIDTHLAGSLIQDNLSSILLFMDHLQELANSLNTLDTSISEEFTKKWKFSASQKVILERLLQRYNVLLEPMTAIPDELSHKGSSKDILRWLNQSVNNASHSI